MKRLTIYLFLIALLLSACMGAPPISQPDVGFGFQQEEEEVPPQASVPTQVPLSPRRGGTLNIAMSLPQTLNPLLNSDPWVGDVLRLVFEPLVVFDAYARPIPNQAITQSIVFSADGASLAVTLRDDIAWEDGSAITSADIAFSIDTLHRHARDTAVYKQNAAVIASHRIIDTRSIEIRLHEAAWATKYWLAFPIISAEYYRGTSMTNLGAARNMHPLGNGPFRFYAYAPAGSLELIASHTAPGGRPYIDRVNAIILRDMEGGSNIHAFEQGLTDVLASNPQDWGRYAAQNKRRADDFLSNTFDFVAFNFNRTIFADIEMRAAIAHSFDFAALGSYFYYEDAAIVPINPASWLAADDLMAYPLDTNRAAELFGQLGFRPGADGILQRRLSDALPAIRLTMEILVNEESPQGLAIAAVLQRGLDDAGVDASVTALPFSAYLQAIDAGDFDIAIGALALSPMPDLSFLTAGRNAAIFGHRSDDLSAHTGMMQRAITESTFRQAAVDAQHYIADNLPIMGVGFRRQVLYTAPHVLGDIEVRQGDIFATINDWFVAP